MPVVGGGWGKEGTSKGRAKGESRRTEVSARIFLEPFGLVLLSDSVARPPAQIHLLVGD